MGYFSFYNKRQNCLKVSEAYIHSSIFFWRWESLRQTFTQVDTIYYKEQTYIFNGNGTQKINQFLTN